jgi:AraC family transcriptional regulator
MNRIVHVTDALAPPAPAQVLLSSAGRWRGLRADFVAIRAGLVHVPATDMLRLGVMFGRAVHADCRCDGRRIRRLQKHGDIDIIPAGLDGVWRDESDCEILRLQLSGSLLEQAAADLGRDALTIAPTFQVRDAGLQAIAAAIKAELESGAPSDALYGETLGFALALRLLQIRDRPQIEARRTFNAKQKRRLVDFIDERLDGSLSLVELALVAGVGVSHFKTLFKATFGAPAHQYVLARRVERARSLILAGDMPMRSVALEAGFSDQSHMARCMRRLLGRSPSDLARGG